MTPATITYAELTREVCQAANALIDLGVSKGDRVAIYMPMIPETVVAMLACARIGAPHTVVFGGFSSEALRSRIIDCDAHVVITADGGYRRGAASALKPAVDEALDPLPGRDERARRTADRPGRRLDRGPRRLVARRRRPAQPEQHTAEPMDAEHPLYVMYTSGTTASPRGSCTRPVATSSAARTPTGRCSTSRPRPTCTGAPPTSAGSPGTATSSTARSPTARPR